MARSKEYLSILSRHECRDATFLKAEPPLVFHKSQACNIWDVEGREYLDLCSGFGVMVLGHNHPAHQAIYSELTTDVAPVVHGMGDVYASSSKAELFATLSSLLPPELSVGSLALSGGQAVELALKTAFLRKPGALITFEGAYHGLDLGLLPLSSRQDFKAAFQHWLPQNLVIELPFGCSEKELEAAIDQLRKQNQKLSAILVEPIQGRAGVRPAPAGWLATLRQFADKTDSLLIYDEVFTGLGRCGQWTFAEDVLCDLLCLGKALGGGLPLSACFGRPEVMSVWPENQGEAIHTGTFFGHPLACRLATATLKVLRDEKLLAKAAEKGQYLQNQLKKHIGDHPAVKCIRGKGLMQGIAFHEAGSGVRLMDELRARQVIALVSGNKGEVLSLSPSLIIKKSEIDHAVKVIAECLETWK